jgi:hypothetical protein
VLCDCAEFYASAGLAEDALWMTKRIAQLKAAGLTAGTTAAAASASASAGVRSGKRPPAEAAAVEGGAEEEAGSGPAAKRAKR